MARDVDPRAETVGLPPRPDDPGASARAPAPGLQAGDRVGRFVIQRRIDQGGMGVVYEASDATLARRVALKLLHADRDPAAAARLMGEARAIAGLSHPNVVAVYEVGIHAGAPFMAMEYVAGKTVRAWLDGERRSWREILDVFIQAARGLAAAHAAGLVHRDVKPDNILVGGDRVRVADFGLARGVGEGAAGPSSPMSPRTDTGSPRVSGTPRYMAPEQTAGLPVDARADQYSLCLSLREALGDRATARMRRVLARGLASDPASRYPSMDALLRALERIRRPRAALLGLGAAVLAGLGVVVFAGTRERPCQTGGRLLAGLWDGEVKARLAASFAATGLPFAARSWSAVEQSVGAYTTTWLDMQREACEATRVHGDQSEETLARRMDCLEGRRTALRVLTRALGRADARVVEKAHAMVEQLPEVSACADRSYLSSVPAAVTASTTELLSLARVHMGEGQLDLAQDEATRAIAGARAAADATLEAEAQAVVGNLRLFRGDYGAAATALNESIASAERAGVTRIKINSWIRLAFVYVRQGQFEPASDVLDLAEAAHRALPDDPGREAGLEYARGIVLQRKGPLDEALRHAEQSLALYTKAYGAEAIQGMHPHTLIAAILRSMGKLDEALAHARRAVEVARALGDDHPLLARSRLVVANTLRTMGKNAESQRELEAVAVTFRRVGGEQSADVATVEMTIGNNLSDLGQVEQALAHFQKSLDIYKALGAPDAENAFYARMNVAVTLSELGRAQEAEPILRAALEEREPRWGARNPRIIELRREHGRALQTLGRIDEAWAQYQRTLEATVASLGQEHPDTALVLSMMAEIERARRRFTDALELDERAQAIMDKRLPPDHQGRIMGRVRLAEDHLGLGQPRRALPLAEEAFAALGADGRKLGVARWVLGRALWESGADRPRGLALAQAARDELAGAGRLHLAPDLEPWLARRGPRR